MGRHSAAYIEAQQGVSTGLRPEGAAKYVGRVGALALALGIGAAAAGGTGIANAEGPSDNSANGVGVQSSPATVESPTAGSRGGKKRMHGFFNGPKTKLGNNSSPPSDDLHTAGSGAGALPGLISDIPKKITAALTREATHRVLGMRHHDVQIMGGAALQLFRLLALVFYHLAEFARQRGADARHAGADAGVCVEIDENGIAL